MPWSTSELGYLAGTTVNTIRHYHRLGLLSEPQRRYNGYKQYDVQHLVRLLRIRRLVGLGVPLSQIDEVTDEAQDASEALREIDAELQTTIERLQRAHADIAVILREDVPADTPAGFEAVASRLSETDRSLVHLYGQLLDDEAMADVRRMVEDDPGDLSAELERLEPDADEQTRQDLVERYAVTLAQNIADYPWLDPSMPQAARNKAAAAEALTEAISALFNPAQQDVLIRATLLAYERLHSSQTGSAATR